MDVRSLGYRTDLALLRLGGTLVEDRGDHLLIRSRHNPTYWWGNYLLLPSVPDDDDIDHWLARFSAEHPDAQHVALGIDCTDGTTADLEGFARRGLEVEAGTVMTASSVHRPRSENTEAIYRPLAGDDDWAQSVALGVRIDDGNYEPEGHRRFVQAKMATYRRLVEAGHGQWFGAFLDGRLVAQLGLFTASAGLARFQSVETDPDFRRRGLAGGLVHLASTYGLERGVQTLVMVADPGYVAIDLYRAVGFADTESQLHVQRAPAADRPFRDQSESR
ncbi:MAG TPA: GNAT family N-acetyltransferase [Jatrophihabitans sp.]|nr:GNAT family N-acetyltransferase [Jatrophihabitans sp.]